MEFATHQQLKAALIHVCDLIVASEPLLTELDTIIGDGDHGIGMKLGFSELRKVLTEREFTNVYDLMRDSGVELVKTMGGASGVIFGTLFIGGHEAVEGKDRVNADDLILFFDAGAQTISRRGRSKAGDMTMLDALLPAIEAMKQARKNTDDVLLIMKAAYEGAGQGVEDTKDMMPKLGRAKNFREKALGYADPGAVSTSIIFKGLFEELSKNN